MKLTVDLLIASLEEAALTDVCNSDMLALQWVARQPEAVGALAAALNSHLQAIPIMTRESTWPAHLTPKFVAPSDPL